MVSAPRSCLLLAAMLATLHVIPCNSAVTTKKPPKAGANIPQEIPSTLALDIPTLEKKIVYLENMLTTRNAEISALLKQLTELTNQIMAESDICDASILECQGNVTSIETKCKQIEANNATSAAKIVQLEREINALKSQNLSYLNDIKVLQGQIKDQQKRLESADASNKLCTTNNTNLTSRLSDVTSAMAAQTVSLRTCTSKTTSLEKSVATLETSVTEQKTQIESYKNEITTITTRNSVLTSTVQQQSTKLQQLALIVEELTSQNRQCTDRSKIIQQEVIALTREVTDLKLRLSTCSGSQELVSCIGDKDALNNETISLRQDMEALEARIAFCEARIVSLQNENKSLLEANINLNSQVSSCKEISNAQKNENIRLELIIKQQNEMASCDGLKEKNNNLTDLNHNLNVDIDICNNRICENDNTALEIINFALKYTIKNIYAEIQKCNKDGKDLKNELSKNKLAMAELKNEISECKSLTLNLKNENNDLTAINSQLTVEIGACTNNSVALESQVTGLQDIIKNLNKLITDCGRKSSTLQHELAAAQRTIAQLTETVSLCEAKSARQELEIKRLQKIIDRQPGCDDPCAEKGMGLDMVTLSTGKYFYSKTMSMSWFAALEFCSSYGLEMVAIESQQEQDAIVQEVMRVGDTLGGFWIGANDIAANGDGKPFKAKQFKWISNGDSLDYTSWLKGEPNNQGKAERCVHVWQQRNVFGWNDVPCVINRQVMCEMPKICSS